MNCWASCLQKKIKIPLHIIHTVDDQGEKLIIRTKFLNGPLFTNISHQEQTSPDPQLPMEVNDDEDSTDVNEELIVGLYEVEDVGLSSLLEDSTVPCNTRNSTSKTTEQKTAEQSQLSTGEYPRNKDERIFDLSLPGLCIFLVSDC